MNLSRADHLLLQQLQHDTTASQGKLAERAGMSRTSCWRRVKEFEDSGLIDKQVALLNPRKLGFQIQVLLSVAMVEHTDENRDSFESHVQAQPELMECYSVSGERDYVLHVMARDMDTYNHFINARILRHPAVRSASSTFVLRRVKYSTALPLLL